MTSAVHESKAESDDVPCGVCGWTLREIRAEPDFECWCNRKPKVEIISAPAG
jgi:hypothetical protein